MLFFTDRPEEDFSEELFILGYPEELEDQEELNIPDSEDLSTREISNLQLDDQQEELFIPDHSTELSDRKISALPGPEDIFDPTRYPPPVFRCLNDSQEAGDTPYNKFCDELKLSIAADCCKPCW